MSFSCFQQFLSRFLLAFCSFCFFPALFQTPDNQTQELQRQQERERLLREQQESAQDVRVSSSSIPRITNRLPASESPCFPISRIQLLGDESVRFLWALNAADFAPDGSHDPATYDAHTQTAARCLGTDGINTVMARIQNAIIGRGFITTRVLAAPQDLTTGTLELTLIPGRIREVRFVSGTSRRATLWNAFSFSRGALLNLREIEQAMENFKRLPTVQADIQITPAEGEDARPGESDMLIAWQQRSPPLRLSAFVDDGGSRATGKLQSGLTLSLDHLFMLNDLFYVSGNRDVFNGNAHGTRSGKGTRGFSAHYSVPWGNWLLGASTNRYRYRQTVAGFSQNYIYSGTSQNTDVRLSRLIYRNARHKFGLNLRGWLRQSQNFIDDTEVQVQRRRTGGWEAGANHRVYIRQGVLDGSFTYRRGTGALRALRAPEEGFGEGTSRMRVMNADIQLMMPFRLGNQRLRYQGRWRAQWNGTPLVAQDRFAIGGRYTVRGFDGELSLMGERGWVLRNELALALPVNQELYAALDFGAVAGASTRWLNGRHLRGFALGLRGAWSGFHWDVFAATSLHKPQNFKSRSITSAFNLGWTY